MKIKISKEHKEELQDQASQIVYFEASMSDEDDAVKGTYLRLVEIYKVAFEAGVNSK